MQAENFTHHGFFFLFWCTWSFHFNAGRLPCCYIKTHDDAAESDVVDASGGEGGACGGGIAVVVVVVVAAPPPVVRVDVAHVDAVAVPVVVAILSRHWKRILEGEWVPWIHPAVQKS